MLDDLGGPDVIVRVPIRGRKGSQSERKAM